MSDSSFVGCMKMTGEYDENLNHISSSCSMQNFIGNNLTYSLYKIMHSDDVEKVELMLKRCKLGDNGMEIVRLLSAEEMYVRFIFKVIYEEVDAVYHIEMFDVDENDYVIEKMNRDIRSLRAFLTVEDNILFQYDSRTKLVKIFMVSDRMDVTFYEMPIEVWQEQMVSKGYVTEESDLEVFHKMCSDIKKLKTEHSYTFRAQIISKGERMDVNRIKFMRVADVENVIEIVGCWSIINETTDEPVEDFCVDTYIDPLTELLNKKSITEYAKEVVADDANHRVAFAMLDLDNFKLVNDTYGHMFGDDVLKAVGKIIKDAIIGMAVAGRMGGDEFFIVFKDYVDELHLRNVFRTIKLTVLSYFKGKMGDIQLSTSIGASRSDYDSKNYYRLFKVADKALYLAKQKGKNRYIIYKTELHGEFIADENDTQVEMKTQFYDETDIHDVNRWMKKVLVNGKAEIQPMLEQMAKSLHFDRIAIYLNRGARTEYEYRRQGVVPGNGTAIQNRKYLDLFKNDMLLIENVNRLEYAVPDVYYQIASVDTKSFIQILIRNLNEDVVGVISFDTCKAFVTYPKKVIEYVNSYGNILAGMVVQEDSKL